MPISEHLRLSVVSRPTFAKDLAEMLVSMLVMSFGVVLSVKAGLGASPIASLPNVISEGSGLSLGTTLVLVYSVMIVMEWAIIRDRKRILLTLSQLPFTYVFIHESATPSICAHSRPFGCMATSFLWPGR